MKRRVFNLLAGVSLVLCVGAVVFWVRSYWRQDIVRWSHGVEKSEPFNSIFWSSIRGGCDIGVNHEDASGGGPKAGLRDYFQWHAVGWELSGGPVAAWDADKTITWRVSYLFKPNSPSPLGFQGDARSGSNAGVRWRSLLVAMPYWAPVCLFAVLPLVGVVRYARRRRRVRLGLCRVCGYDMRATPERCPECGAAPGKG